MAERDLIARPEMTVASRADDDNFSVRLISGLQSSSTTYSTSGTQSSSAAVPTMRPLIARLAPALRAASAQRAPFARLQSTASPAPAPAPPSDSPAAAPTSATPAAPADSAAAAPPAAPSVPVSLVAELRRQRTVPLALAREALIATQNDVPAAVRWLDSGSSGSTARRAEKVAGRSTNEGTIAIANLNGKRVAMVHLGCETDFVARNEVFVKTARGVAETVAFLDVPAEGQGARLLDNAKGIESFPIPSLLKAPLIAIAPKTPEVEAAKEPESAPSTPATEEATTVQQALRAALSQTGENLQLLRACSFAAPFPSDAQIRYIPSAFAHGSPDGFSGRIASIVIISAQGATEDKQIADMIHGPAGAELEQALQKLARDLARQAVGFPTKAIDRSGEGAKELDEGEVLLEQVFMMRGDERPVYEVLAEWGNERGLKVQVAGLQRWGVGELLEQPTPAEVTEE